MSPDNPAEERYVSVRHTGHTTLSKDSWILSRQPWQNVWKHARTFGRQYVSWHNAQRSDAEDVSDSTSELDAELLPAASLEGVGDVKVDIVEFSEASQLSSVFIKPAFKRDRLEICHKW